MNTSVWVAGAGIGGLATALALARSGASVEIMEQADTLGEVGAGLQLGPNAVRVLREWGLFDGLSERAAFPEELRVRDALSGRQLGRLPMGAAMRARYGEPYLTVHRADLHALLLAAVRQQQGVELHLGARLAQYQASETGVQVVSEDGRSGTGDALIGADGLWSRVRAHLLGPQPVRASGHLAYRGMVDVTRLPVALRAQRITAWLGPRLHVVHYPVRAGERFNVVAVVHGELGQGHGGDPGQAQDWNHLARGADLHRALGPVCAELTDMLRQVDGWRLWALNDRPPLAGAQEHAQGRVALLGDAAHPLRPYLAQGAAMALEDAWTLGRLLANAGDAPDWPALLRRYAETRWARNARVQRRSERNGEIFHATGAQRWARNVSLALFGKALMDNRWLYGGPPVPG